MYEEYSMDGVEDILSVFDSEETAKVIEQHINEDQYGIGPTIDYYRPYYVHYKSLKVDIDTGMTEDYVKQCKLQAREVALKFIDAICKKFRISVDEFWIDNAPDEEVQGVTIILYDFFILHFKELLLEVITRYIDINNETLANQFDISVKGTKDSAYGALQQKIPYNFAVIGANVYDVCDIILSNISETEFIDLIDADNELQSHMKTYFEEGKISGNFVDVIEEMLHSTDISLKGYLGFEIIAYLKNTYSNQHAD